MKIAVIGSYNCDYIFEVDHFVNPGETLLATNQIIRPGGKGYNQAKACAQLDNEVFFFGAVKHDDEIISIMNNEGIKTSYIYQSNQPNGCAYIQKNKENDNCIVVYPGANNDVTTTYIQSIEQHLLAMDVIMMQLEIPLETVIYCIEFAYKHAIPLILNPAPAVPLRRDILTKCYCITPNLSELQLLTNTTIKSNEDIVKTCQSLLDQDLQQIVVTLGGNGCYVANKDLNQFIDGHKVKVNDTIGAGDYFNAALATFIFQYHYPLDKAAYLANKAAALKISGYQPITLTTITDSTI